MTYIPMYVQVFFDWVIRASMMASVLVVLVVILKWILRNKLQPRWHYLMWLPIVIRLLLPWAPESSYSLYNLFPVKGDLAIENRLGSLEDPLTVQASHESVQEKQVELKQSFVNSLSNIPLKEALLFVWLLGVIAMSLITAIANIKLYRHIKKQPNLTNQAILDVLERCKQQMSIKQWILLTATDALPSPAVFGFINPRILLSSSLIQSLNAEQLRYIFHHELAHIKRRDVAMNGLMHALIILHWFNPFMWYVYSAMRVDQEVACDALALSHIPSEQKAEYGQTIINLLEHYSKVRSYPSLVGLSGNNKQLKRRILMIKHFKRNSLRLSVLGLVTVLAVCVFSLVNAQGKPATAVKAMNKNQISDAKLKQIVEVEQLAKPETAISPYDVLLVNNANHRGATAYQSSFALSPVNGTTLEIYVKNNNKFGTAKFKVYKDTQDMGYLDVNAGHDRTRTFSVTDGSGISGDWEVYVTTSDGHALNINVNARQY